MIYSPGRNIWVPSYMAGLVNGGLVNSGHALVNAGIIRVGQLPFTTAWFIDHFTDTNGTVFPNSGTHTPDLGGAYHNCGGVGGQCKINTNQVEGQDTGADHGVSNDAVPPTANYLITWTIKVGAGSAPSFMVFGRLPTTGSDPFTTNGSYNAGYVAGAWTLRRGSAVLASTTVVPNTGQTYACALKMDGTTISFTVDGTHVTGSPVTDANISAKGVIGMWLGSWFSSLNGQLLDDLQAFV